MLLRYAAFTRTPDGGNPAGVVLDAGALDAVQMQRIATEVGYSETAFLQRRDDAAHDVRYFSPLAEVPFCGHATIASAVALAQRDGPGEQLFHTQAGAVPVCTTRVEGECVATLTSVPPRVEPAPPALLADVLSALRWLPHELDPALPPRIAFAGAHHLVIAAGTHARLRALDYDFDILKRVMLEAGLTTVALVWRASAHLFHARNPFPVGGVVEDPATGAAAAAFGACLRAGALIDTPATITVLQGEDMGRPSRLIVDIPRDGSIRVSGNAVQIADSVAIG